MFRNRILAAAGLLVALARPAAAAEPDARSVEFFEKKIRPVLVQHCYECHSAAVAKPKGGLRLDTRDGFRKGGNSGPAFVPGKADDSLLLEALRHDSLKMPPKAKLPASVVADFAHWIKLGAPDPRSGKPNVVARRPADGPPWAFLKPVKQAPPPVRDAAWVRNDVDRFVLAKLEAQGIRPNADADRRTLLRRLSFDLIGLPPTPEEIAAFERDTAPEALARQVDRLLASPHFGERWGRHWLDVVHYAENSGVVKYNMPYPFAWRYRDYVIDAFNKDKRYDQFVREQIAGDLLPAQNDRQRDEQLIATGFLALGRLRLAKKDPQVVMDNIDEQIDATTQGFLGLTVACARCHDHKFDPISQKDYYALAGIFRSTTPVLGGVYQGKGAVKKGKAPKKAVAVALRTGPEPRLAMGAHEGSAGDCRVCIRGDAKDLGPTVPRGIPAALAAGKPLPIRSGQSGRLQLANWLASPDNPLTARVHVNRLWHHLFGRGLVPTVDNFGAMSEPCSHPELLDHLAVRFMEDGWSIKRLIRTLVLTRTYGLSSDFAQAAHDADAENLLLWRHSPRRLQAEAIRDAMLAVSGRLDPTPLRGSPIKTPPAAAKKKKKKGPPATVEHNHRSVYLPVVREGVHEMMHVFDFADPSLVFGRREVTTVPTQALFLMNSPFVLEQSEHAARRLLGVQGLDDAGRVALAFRLNLGRTPTDAEQKRSLAFLSDYGKAMQTQERNAAQRSVRTWAGFCQALFESAEFRYVR